MFRWYQWHKRSKCRFAGRQKRIHVFGGIYCPLIWFWQIFWGTHLQCFILIWFLCGWNFPQQVGVGSLSLGRNLSWWECHFFWGTLRMYVGYITQVLFSKKIHSIKLQKSTVFFCFNLSSILCSLSVLEVFLHMSCFFGLFVIWKFLFIF